MLLKTTKTFVVDTQFYAHCLRSGQLEKFSFIHVINFIYENVCLAVKKIATLEFL